MKLLKSFLLIACTFVSVTKAHAFRAGGTSLGFGYYSQNFMNQIAADKTGKPSFMGATNYPINFKYDWQVTPNWFLAPQLSYTAVPRKAAGDTATVTLSHLVFQIGQNFGRSTNSVWDYSFGPGLLQESIKGDGGTTQLNNGTGTATFFLPKEAATVRKITMNLGSSWTFGAQRLGLDIIVENAFSSTKRTQSMMFSYAFVFGGKN